MREQAWAEGPPFLIGNIWEVGDLTGGVLLKWGIMGFPPCGGKEETLARREGESKVHNDLSSHDLCNHNISG